MRFCLLIFWGIALTLAACTSHKTEETQEQTAAPEQDISAFDPALKKLLGTDTSGAFRGISLGQSKEKVKILEASWASSQGDSLVSETDSLINYTISFTATEEADLIYYFTPDNKLKKIEADIYPPSESAQSKLFKQLNTFYSAKYGKGAEVDHSEVLWNIKQPQSVIILKKTGNEKVHDLQLSFVSLAEDAGSK